jgi:hypothetical protein
MTRRRLCWAITSFVIILIGILGGSLYAIHQITH